MFPFTASSKASICLIRRTNLSMHAVRNSNCGPAAYLEARRAYSSLVGPGYGALLNTTGVGPFKMSVVSDDSSRDQIHAVQSQLATVSVGPRQTVKQFNYRA